MNSASSESGTVSPRRATDPIWIGAALLLALHMAAAWLPNATTWAFNYWSALPLGARIGLFAVLLALMTPPAARRIGAVLPRGRGARWAGVGALIVAAVLMVVFRSRALAYGDGYSVLAAIRDSDVPKLIGNLLLQPLDIYSHWIAYKFVLLPLGGTLELTYALIGALCGVFSMLAIVRLARALTNNPAQRAFLVGCALCSGAVYLWFGHVESYTLVQTFMLWSLAFLVQSDGRPRRPVLAWVCWLFAVASHALAVVVLPALLWGSVAGTRLLRRDSRWGRAGLWLIAGMVLGAIAAYLGQHYSPKTLVPLWPTSAHNYYALSPAHLLDVVNLIMFAAPIAPLALVIAIRRRNSENLPEAAVLLGLAASGLFVFAFWIDPMLGAFRDWDLLCAYGIPLSLVCGGILIRRMQHNWRPWSWVTVAMLAVGHVGVWVAVNQSETASAERVDRIIHTDSHYTGDYYDAGRRTIWALILSNWLGDQERASGHYLYRLKFAPDDAITWTNLGITYQHRRMLDSAAICYQKAMKINPRNALYALAYGQVRHAQGRYALARVALERAVMLRPDLYEAQMALSMLYLDMDLLDLAESAALTARQIDPTRADADSALVEVARLRREAKQD
jgi:tetratricopeptide (TPR) repeat protein